MTPDNNFMGEMELDSEVLGYENEANDWDDDGEDTITFSYKGRERDEDIMDDMICR